MITTAKKDESRHTSNYPLGSRGGGLFYWEGLICWGKHKKKIITRGILYEQGSVSISHCFATVVNCCLSPAPTFPTVNNNQRLLLPQGFRPEGEIPRRHSSKSRVY